MTKGKVLVRVNPQWNNRWLRAIIIFLIVGFTIENKSSFAQIIPDGTLGNENSLVTPNVDVNNSPASLIEGGANKGVNLFHSFREFNVGALERVYFANPTGIERIFSRVTGNNISNIDGVLGVLGNADLFFLNPNGIIFGENASLDVNGSFIATTADSIVFGDEFVFSASNPTEVPPLLTVDIIPGLQYGNNPGTITNLSVANNRLGLQVPTDKTMALVGGDIEINGGVISAFNGRVELGSVGENSLVTADTADNGYTFNYDDVEQFKDLNFNSALIDLSGDGGGDLQLQGKQVSLREFSQINSNTLGSESGGLLQIKAAESITLSDSLILADVNSDALGNGGIVTVETKDLKIIDGGLISVNTFGNGNGGELKITVDNLEVSGSTPDGQFPSDLSAVVGFDATGSGGNLIVNTESLTIANGARVSVGVFGRGNAGNLNVTAKEIEIIGETPDGRFGSSLAAQVNSSGIGDGGNLTIKTETLKVAEGAQISVSIFGQGNAGNLNVTAKEIEIVGTSPDSVFSSGLFADINQLATGEGGSIVLETERLTVADGGEISAGISGEGNAGDVKITATEIEVIGTRPNGNFSSGLFSQVNSSAKSGSGGSIVLETERLTVADGAQISVGTGSNGNGGSLDIKANTIEVIGESADGRIGSGLFSVSDGRGNGGEITVATEQLSILDGARISASSLDEGLAGNVEINTDAINLDDGAITTETDAGDGGNISLQIEDLLILRNNSQISTTAGKIDAGGDGGDITINSDVIAAIPQENSDITANAFNGRGGNINITTQGIFGVEFRAEQTPFSDITASSEFGLDGTVAINTPDVNPEQGRINLPTTFATPPLDTSCQAINSTNSSSFVNLGRGGLPKNPREVRDNREVWDDLRFPVPNNLDNSPDPNLQSRTIRYRPIVEAQGWIVGDNGNIILVADVELQNNLNNSPNYCGEAN